MNRAKVLVTCRWPDEVERELVNLYDATIIGLNAQMPSGGLRAALQSFDYICPTITDRFTAADFSDNGVRVRALCNFGAGLNHLPLDACRSAGIVVTNTPDVLTEDTADIALLLTMMAARRAGEGERLVRQGQWRGWTPTSMLGTSLAGKTLGLIGMGRIGQAFAHKAHAALGMRIIYFSRTPKDPSAFDFPVKYCSLETLASQADVISLHAPSSPETRDIVNSDFLSRMKPSAIVINTARGDLVDEAALIAALCDGTIAAAGLDVFAGEPDVNPALLSLENVVALPHLGSATHETRIAMGMRAVENLRAIVAGRDPPDRAA